MSMQGAASLIEDKSILTAAAQILAVEAYHAGAIRLLLYQNMAKTAFKSPKLLVRDVVQAISDLRDAVDGSDDRDQGITMGWPAYSANIVPTDGNKLVYTRDTKQVRRLGRWLSRCSCTLDSQVHLSEGLLSCMHTCSLGWYMYASKCMALQPGKVCATASDDDEGGLRRTPA